VSKFADIFKKYKTYDTSSGFGNPSQWKGAFRERMGIDEAQEIVNDIKEETSPLLSLRACKTFADLKKTYYNLMQVHHPDHGGDLKLAKQIVALFTVLKASLKKE
jgi:hypothetical protein